MLSSARWMGWLCLRSCIALLQASSEEEDQQEQGTTRVEARTLDQNALAALLRLTQRGYSYSAPLLWRKLHPACTCS